MYVFASRMFTCLTIIVTSAGAGAIRVSAENKLKEARKARVMKGLFIE